MTVKETYQTATTKGLTEIVQFMRDMKRAGLRMRTYDGRNFWHGPAVVASDVSDVMFVTKIRCQWDRMGEDFIIYPRQSL